MKFTGPLRLSGKTILYILFDFYSNFQLFTHSLCVTNILIFFEWKKCVCVFIRFCLQLMFVYISNFNNLFSHNHLSLSTWNDNLFKNKILYLTITHLIFKFYYIYLITLFILFLIFYYFSFIIFINAFHSNEKEKQLFLKNKQKWYSIILFKRIQ